MAKPKLNLKLRGETKLAMTHLMSQALKILQMPLLELEAFIEQEILDNPHLTRDYPQLPPNVFIENLESPAPSLYSHLLHQAERRFSKNDLEKAKEIIGNLNEKGFYLENNGDPSILKIIQHFDPVGVAASCVQNSLLIQLEERMQKDHLAYRVIENHYDLFLHQRLKELQKKLFCNEKTLRESLALIRTLTPSPASHFSTAPSPQKKCDISIDEEGNIQLLLTLVPKIEKSPLYKGHFERAKWLVRSLEKRRELLTKIGEEIYKANRSFFISMTKKITPLKAKELADRLSVHESTLSRAIKDKLIDTPAGVFPIRLFFNHHVMTRQLIRDWVANEENPLTDEALRKKLEKEGIVLSRRMVTKLRKSLSIPSSSQRRCGRRELREYSEYGNEKF
ncbi:MAG: hypothetical protein WDZ28_01240 [Simkaniaceae bacterium]